MHVVLMIIAVAASVKIVHFLKKQISFINMELSCIIVQCMMQKYASGKNSREAHLSL